MISFNNTEIAFRSKSNVKLKKAYYLFKLMGKPALASVGGKMAELAFYLHLPIKGIIKSTVFQQFCGGESMDKCALKIEELAASNVKTILDYSVEGKDSEKDFNRTMKQTLESLDFAYKNNNIPFAVFKITGVARFGLLEKVNYGKQLSETEQQEYDRALHRISKICKKAHQFKIPVMVDAEESWIQDTIDGIVEDMMRSYNKESVIVYNTLQMYRHDRLDYFKRVHRDSQHNGYFLGMKIVRGAYMEKENERAIENGYITPIQPNKDACDKDYNLALKYACENINGISICAGTHNEDSSVYLIELMDEFEIEKNNPKIYFAQLLGMSDHISFNLAEDGFNTVKYVPYGPVKDVLPYLIRRAEENTSIAGQTGRELNLIEAEIKRRRA
jgi:proline dehydrogenase